MISTFGNWGIIGIGMIRREVLIILTATLSKMLWVKDGIIDMTLLSFAL
jgi:hypothetical protein